MQPAHDFRCEPRIRSDPVLVLCPCCPQTKQQLDDGLCSRDTRQSPGWLTVTTLGGVPCSGCQPVQRSHASGWKSVCSDLGCELFESHLHVGYGGSNIAHGITYRRMRFRAAQQPHAQSGIGVVVCACRIQETVACARACRTCAGRSRARSCDRLNSRLRAVQAGAHKQIVRPRPGMPGAKDCRAKLQAGIDDSHRCINSSHLEQRVRQQRQLVDAGLRSA